MNNLFQTNNGGMEAVGWTASFLVTVNLSCKVNKARDVYS